MRTVAKAGSAHQITRVSGHRWDPHQRPLRWSAQRLLPSTFRRTGAAQYRQPKRRRAAEAGGRRLPQSLVPDRVLPEKSRVLLFWLLTSENIQKPGQQVV